MEFPQDLSAKEIRTILLSVLTSSTATLLITAYFQNRQANKAYKNEYYKKIIEKRFNAYEDLEDVLRRLSTRLYDKEGTTLLVLQDPKTFNDFFLSIFQAQLNAKWLGKESQAKLREMSIIVAKIGEEIGKIPTTESIKIVSKPYLGELLRLRTELLSHSLSDFENLHNVDKFFSPYRKGGFLSQVRQLFQKLIFRKSS